MGGLFEDLCTGLCSVKPDSQSDAEEEAPRATVKRAGGRDARNLDTEASDKYAGDPDLSDQ